MKKLSFASLAITALLALSSRAQAVDTLNLSLLSSLQTTTPGTTISFTATAFALPANVSTLFLNGDSATVDFPLTIDDTPFLVGFPLSLAPGGSFTGTLFTVTLPSDTLTGSLFTGSFQ